jgi:hypothetical protein
MLYFKILQTSWIEQHDRLKLILDVSQLATGSTGSSTAGQLSARPHQKMPC